MTFIVKSVEGHPQYMVINSALKIKNALKKR